ncbi:MAG: glycosyltransferase family 39 protein [Gemmataceae bacterium]
MAVLVVATYFVRIDTLAIRGEESRRATIAQEMLWTGDYVVPRQFGEPFLSRPPMHNWLISLAATLRGQLDPIAVRLPTVTALLLTAILVYAYGRTFLGRLGALTAAIGFATMAEVLQLGRLAECDTLFTFLLCSGVLLWHWGYTHNWPEALTWGLGYGFTALAALTKGPQPPVYFGATVVLFLLWRRDWRTLFSVGHIFGVAVFAVIVLSWTIPFERACGWEATRRIWGNDSTSRFENWTAVALARHLVMYPIEFIGCTSPWSLLLGAFLSKRFRQALAQTRPTLVYLAIYGMVGFIPCWIPPGAMTRYVYPLYPAVAILAGLVVDQIVRVDLSLRLRRAWRVAHTLCVVGMAATVASLFAVKLLNGWLPAEPWKLPPAHLAALAGVAVVGGMGLCFSRQCIDRQHVRWAVGALAVFMATGYTVAVVDATSAKSVDAASAVANIVAQMPAHEKLVGIDGTHHLFAYHYRHPIVARSSRDVVFGDNSDIRYFCYEALGTERKPLPFPWEELAVVSCDRNRQTPPVNVVIVGRRIEPSRQDVMRSVRPTGWTPSHTTSAESARP